MKKTTTNLLSILSGLFLLFQIELIAQQPLHYWGNIEEFLQEQSAQTFAQAYKVLDAYPPTVYPEDERKLALYTIDCLLHDIRLDNGKAFTGYMENVVNRIIQELQQGGVSNKVKILRFYNHGFIIQTSTITVGIDLVRGGNNNFRYISDQLMEQVVNYCDILFITHLHGDHADEAVAKMFYEKNKEIIVPIGLWENKSPLIKHRRGNSMIKEKVSVSQKGQSLEVYIYPGNQGDVLNNVYAVTLPEGMTIMHTGDQSNAEDLDWIMNIQKEVNIDVLLVHCWMPQIKEMVNGSGPDLVICGHENEMGHSVDHREPYWLTFRRMEGISTPYIIMAWGEKYFYSLKP